LIFLDEFAVQLNMTRDQARAPVGVRAEVTESWARGTHQSVIAAIGLNGVRASMMLEGAFDQTAFDAFVEHFLVPQLQPGEQVWCDRVRFHFSRRAQALVEGAGARMEYLPAYSPQFNPIEECISKIKAMLRTWSADTERKLRNALKRALARVTLSDIRGWFTHCGYA
jgi:transposase